MNIFNKVNIRESKITAELCRADGTRVPLGVVSYFNRNFFKSIYHRVRFAFIRCRNEITAYYKNVK